MTRKLRVMLIGPLPRPGVTVGGTQVSFASLVESLRARGTFELVVVDTSRGHGYVRNWRMRIADAVALAATLLAVLRRGRACDAIAFHASPGGMALGGPLVALAARCLGRPFVARVFGGSFDRTLARLPRPWRALVEHTVLRAELLLLQTTDLCRAFGGARGVRRLPTTRPMPREVPREPRACRRFLFLSQLRPEKGVAEAVTAIELVSTPCMLSVAGPLLPGASLASFEGSSRSRYVGVVEPGRVGALLAEHDALVFPSYWDGEGLPGVVIEAMQHGLPVIATRWRAIPELVAHGVNGLLVEPRDARELAAAMDRLASDDALFRSLRGGALETGRAHSIEPWTERFEQWLEDVVSNGAPRAEHDAARAHADPPAALPATREREEVRR